VTPQFFLSQPAIDDITEIADYITSQSGLAQGEYFLAKLDEKFAHIARFPKLGRQRDDIFPGVKSLSVDNYLVFYTATPSRVDILRVVSGYRDLKMLFEEAD